MTTKVDKPDRELTDSREVLLGFLDYYRSFVARLVEGLPEELLRSTRLPSGWTPLDMLKHLVYMENRWFRWGFGGEQIADPHGDKDETGRWYARPDETPAGLVEELLEAGRRTRMLAEQADLGDLSALGGRFNEGDELHRPTLVWILAYVLQEYAAHAGQLDIVRELSDGTPSISIRPPGQRAA
jgi:hypothetical protein